MSTVTEASESHAQGDGTPMLELDDVTAGYGDTIVLWDVTLRVPPSAVVALLGPNGAGKTTLLRTASGLVQPMRGRVRLDGQDVTGRRADVRARAGLCHLPEGRGIFPSLSVRENLVLESPKGKERDAIGQAMSVFPVLGNRLKQLAGSLSGGEQQMLAIVRAFVTNPKIVVVDEASLGLAPVIVEQIFENLRRVVATGAALLIVEQYINRALDLADTVYLMNHGRIAFHGPADEVQEATVFEQYLGIEVGPAT